MKAVILDGSQASDLTGQRVRTALMAQLQADSWNVEHFALCEHKIGNCAGDFFCWVRTPGICNVNDDNRTIAEALANSDLMVYLTPITFGGYSSILKGMVDHQIQNISPFFAKLDGEVHHAKRYEHNPDLLAAGWTDMPNLRSESIFRHLVERNAQNWHAKKWVSAVVHTGQSASEIQNAAQSWLDELKNGLPSQRIKLPDSANLSASFQSGTERGLVGIQRAVLLVGSPKTRKSTSHSLGGYLYDQLGQQSIQTETIFLYTVLRSAKKWQALLAAVGAADLVTLAFPIYVDTLPAPVIEALERLVAYRQSHGSSRLQRFTAIANCGLPEVGHTAVGLANCEVFARRAGFVWAGSLALGSGEIINGVPLVEGGGATIRIRQALDSAAEALAQARAIPKTASDAIAKPIVPHWLYRIMGWRRWNQWAAGHGVKKLLKRQPYLTKAK